MNLLYSKTLLCSPCLPTCICYIQWCCSCPHAFAVFNFLFSKEKCDASSESSLSSSYCQTRLRLEKHTQTWKMHLQSSQTWQMHPQFSSVELQNHFSFFSEVIIFRNVDCTQSSAGVVTMFWHIFPQSNQASQWNAGRHCLRRVSAMQRQIKESISATFAKFWSGNSRQSQISSIFSVTQLSLCTASFLRKGIFHVIWGIERVSADKSYYVQNLRCHCNV